MVPEHPVFQTPGAMIKAAREAKGLSLETLSAETRIPDRLLAAIEIDDFDQLSEALYTRSFLRSCAQSLGLDPGVLIDSYEHMLTEQEPDVPADQTWEEETEVQRIGVMPWSRIGLIVIILAGVALAVWAGISLFGGGAADQPISDPIEQDPTESAGEFDDATSDSLVVRDTVSTATPGDDAIDGPSDDGPVTIDIGGSVVSPDPGELAAVATLPRGGPTLVFDGGETWPLVLRVVLDHRLDIAVGSDGDRQARDVAWPDRAYHGVPEEGVVPGRLYAVGGRHVAYWGAADHLLLKLSQAEGVTVTLNGRPLDIPTRIVGHEWVLDRSRLDP